MNTATTSSLSIALRQPSTLADASAQLRQHLHSCRRSAGPLHRLHCIAEVLYDAIATRLVTTTALLLVGLIAVNALV